MEGQINVYVLRMDVFRKHTTVYPTKEAMIMGWVNRMKSDWLGDTIKLLWKSDTLENHADTKVQMMLACTHERFDADLVNFDAFLNDCDPDTTYCVCPMDLTVEFAAKRQKK